MYTIIKEVREVAAKIGQFFLQENNNDYAKTADIVTRLNISRIDVFGEEIIVHLSRPSLLIGRLDRTIDGLEKYLGKKIRIVEDRDCLLHHLIPQEPVDDSLYMEPEWDETDEIRQKVHDELNTCCLCGSNLNLGYCPHCDDSIN